MGKKLDGAADLIFPAAAEAHGKHGARAAEMALSASLATMIAIHGKDAGAGDRAFNDYLSKALEAVRKAAWVTRKDIHSQAELH